jgi:hypothetical protein
MIISTYTLGVSGCVGIELALVLSFHLCNSGCVCTYLWGRTKRDIIVGVTKFGEKPIVNVRKSNIALRFILF